MERYYLHVEKLESTARVFEAIVVVNYVQTQKKDDIIDDDLNDSNTDGFDKFNILCFS